MARLEKNADPQPQTEGAETLPAFVREVSWLRWLLRRSAERRLTMGFVLLAALL